MKFSQWLTATTLLASTTLVCTTVSADIFKADALMDEKQYAEAKQHYLAAATIGNARAYYQLANMYSKGQGVEQSTLDALLNFSLAAEYNFHDSKAVLDNALALFDKNTEQQLRKTLTDYRAKYGKAVVDHKYYPVLDTEKLSKKVTFNKKAALPDYFYDDDLLGSSLVQDSFAELDNISSFDEDDDGSALLISSPKKPFVVLDLDVSPDGSIRHYEEIQTFGSNTQQLIDSFLSFPIDSPDLEGRETPFVHRAYLGAATFNKFHLRDENEALYNEVRRISKKAKTAKSLHDRYLGAITKLNFKAIAIDKTEAENDLKAIAEQGHPGAMYEYGMVLYRQQKEIPQAIYWISEASKYGLTRAEYRLGRLLTESPWIKKDEAKALFWLEQAMNDGHKDAALRAAAIKLDSRNKALRDTEGAIAYLESIKDSLGSSPEYYYYLALTHKESKPRDYPNMLSNLRKAIGKGKFKNWDVSDWESLLTELTTGTVTSCEYTVDGGDTCL